MINLLGSPSSILDFILLISISIAATVFVYYQVKNQSSKILRSTVEDQGKRILFLEGEVKRLSDNYKEAKFKKDYLKGLILQAMSSKASIDNHLKIELENLNNNSKGK